MPSGWAISGTFQITDQCGAAHGSCGGSFWAYAGDTATSYDPHGHLLVVLEGDFNLEDPTAAQLDSLVRVLMDGTQPTAGTTVAPSLVHSFCEDTGNRLTACAFLQTVGTSRLPTVTE